MKQDNVRIKSNKQKKNWIIDAMMFGGFLSMFFLDFTGLPFHQWVGVAIGMLAIFHILIHWDWLRAVTSRYFEASSKVARRNYLLDAALAGGFLMILTTGLVISSWLNLPLQNYESWKNAHVFSSILSMAIVMAKIGLHWRWISEIGKRYVFRTSSSRVAVLKPSVAQTNVANRREFLKVVGITGVASIIAVSRALKSIEGSNVVYADVENSSLIGSTQESTQTSVVTSQVTSTEVTTAEASAPVSTVTSVPTATATSASPTTVTCIVRCNRGCSYPGHCRRYSDQNGNGKCDYGECV